MKMLQYIAYKTNVLSLKSSPTWIHWMSKLQPSLRREVTVE